MLPIETHEEANFNVSIIKTSNNNYNNNNKKDIVPPSSTVNFNFIPDVVSSRRCPKHKSFHLAPTTCSLNLEGPNFHQQHK